MKAGDGILFGTIIFVFFACMKLTDIQLERLDKRITSLEWRMHIVELKLKDKHYATNMR